MSLPLYTVDAFTSVPFSGNPAAVCLDANKQGLSDDVMQRIGAEINISETSFVRILQPQDSFNLSNRFGLRWFTPTSEVPLCGHATLASAIVLFSCVGNKCKELTFETLSGDLIVSNEYGKVVMNFPLNTPVAQDYDKFEPLLQHIAPTDRIVDVHLSSTLHYLMVRLKDMSRSDFEALKPAVEKFTSAPLGGSTVKLVIITVQGHAHSGYVDPEGKPYDFASRCFAPWYGVHEDPVTGSAHTVTAGYWAAQLDKTHLYARQCSPRGGEVHMKLCADSRVEIIGSGTVVIQGQINVT